MVRPFVNGLSLRIFVIQKGSCPEDDKTTGPPCREDPIPGDLQLPLKTQRDFRVIAFQLGMTGSYSAYGVFGPSDNSRFSALCFD